MVGAWSDFGVKSSSGWDDFGRADLRGGLWQQFPLQPDGLRDFYLTAAQLEMAEALDRKLAHWRAEMRRARPIIAQWSEWEKQTRAEAWR